MISIRMICSFGPILTDFWSKNTHFWSKNDNFGVFVTILRKISLFMQSFYMQNHDPSSLKPPPKLIKIPDLARFWFYLSRSSSFKIIQVQSTSKNFPSTMRRLNIYIFWIIWAKTVPRWFISANFWRKISKIWKFSSQNSKNLLVFGSSKMLAFVWFL